MGFLPIGVSVIGLISFLLLGRSLYHLRSHKNEILHLTGTVRLRSLMLGLMAGPPLVLGVLVLVFLFVLKDQTVLRAAHAFLVLGLWMVLTLAFILMIILTRLGQRPSITDLAAAVLSVPLVAYLTPLERFADVFSLDHMILPLVTGIFLVVACYGLILIARRELLH